MEETPLIICRLSAFRQNPADEMAEERVQPIALHREMQRSYLEYAMSVIVGQTLPMPVTG